MKKLFSLFLAVYCFCAVTACVVLKEMLTDPEQEPEITVKIPELFSPDPDVVDDVMTIGISINHPASIKEWHILVQPNRQRQARQDGEAGQRQPGDQAAQRQPRQEGEAGQRQPRQEGEEGQGQRQRQRRGPFFEQTGQGKPPAEWKWNGKGTSGETVQSVTDYLFTLTVTDSFGNTGTFEGIISVDVFVKKEGDIYKIVVPSIVFPGSSADLTRVSDEEMRANRRVLNLIGRALNRFEGYQITVEGHSNPLTPPGTPERAAEERSDQALSLQRAQAVVNYLADNSNIARTRLKAEGKSCTQPVADYDDEEENWKNRRVEFVLAK
jgi:outer membrane protein OmpA-like peptidoglycan-associated protein